jgi:hypothetical protein
MITISYDADVVAWASEQARLIRAGRFDQLDLEHIAEEIESDNCPWTIEQILADDFLPG